MLTALRRLAATWVAKVLFALLILSFAIWGIGDLGRNLFGRDLSVARVGDQAIGLEEAQRAVRRELQRLSRQLGTQFDADPRIRRAVAEQAIDSLVQDRVLRAEAERLRIAVPDAAMRELIFSLPGFRGGVGGFSRPVFESFLRSNDLSEGQFLALVRTDLARQQVSMAIRAGAVGPDVLARPLLRWQQETRAATIVSLPLAEAAEPAPPEDAALRRYHENNPEQFSTPETRAAQVAVLTAALIGREVEVTDAELAAAFEQRRGQFEAPEKRMLEQVLVQDESQARELAATWRAGADFAAVNTQAAAAGGQALELGTVERAGLPLPELAAAAFAAPAGGVTDPVRSPFGWHVVKVVRIEPGRVAELATVREPLRAELVAERAADLAFERANRVEDALAGGATLAEVAQRFNLGFADLVTDATGHALDGSAVALPVIEAARPALLRAVFTAERGAQPRLAETEAGFVAVQVQSVTPPALQPFESVEAQVRAAWALDARRRAQEARAAGLLAATRDGKTLAEAAQAAGLGFREVGALVRPQRREAPPGVVPAELLAPIFELQPREASMVPTRDGFAVAQLLEVVPGDPDADPAGLTRTKAEVEQAMADDLEAQFLGALRTRADIRINPRLVDQVAQP